MKIDPSEITQSNHIPNTCTVMLFIIWHNEGLVLGQNKHLVKGTNAQWESALVVGGQQFAQIGNYFTIW